MFYKSYASYANYVVYIILGVLPIVDLNIESINFLMLLKIGLSWHQKPDFHGTKNSITLKEFKSPIHGSISSVKSLGEFGFQDSQSVLLRISYLLMQKWCFIISLAFHFYSFGWIYCQNMCDSISMVSRLSSRVLNDLYNMGYLRLKVWKHEFEQLEHFESRPSSIT